MKKILLTFAVCVLMAAPALAEPTLQQVLDGITLLPNPGVSSVNVATDTITDGLDSYWAITAAGASTSTIIIELAAWAPQNAFGVYDMGNPATKVQVFAGASAAGAQAMLSIQADGSVYLNLVDTGTDFGGNAFGYYLNSPGGVFYSDTILNPDSPIDHMWALQGKDIDTVQILPWAPGLWTTNEYVLAFEDTLGGGDMDHQDFVVMVESVMPIIPAPGAILLGGIGVGIVGWMRRRRSL